MTILDPNGVSLLEAIEQQHIKNNRTMPSNEELQKVDADTLVKFENLQNGYINEVNTNASSTILQANLNFYDGEGNRVSSSVNSSYGSNSYFHIGYLEDQNDTISFFSVEVSNDFPSSGNVLIIA
jgi:hypothetical protein